MVDSGLAVVESGIVVVESGLVVVESEGFVVTVVGLLVVVSTPAVEETSVVVWMLVVVEVESWKIITTVARELL